MLSLLPLVLLAINGAIAAPSDNQGFDAQTIAKVRDNMLNISTHSWELGAAAQALIELEVPSLSVFSGNRLPPTKSQNPSVRRAATDVFDLATRIVRARPPGSPVLIDGDGAAGDPASLGVAVALTGWTRTNRSDLSFDEAAGLQLDHILNHVPRAQNGAISHRESQVQLWADFTYMVPPFIAYEGVLQTGGDKTWLLREAYNQCKWYREILGDESGLWKHIVLGTGLLDPTHWGTGNAWAAAGMLRVLQTITHSDVSWQFTEERRNLTGWVEEILTSTWPHQGNNGTLFNVIDDPTTFADTSSTALLAASTYRLASITNNHTLIPFADRALQLIKDSVDGNGWLHNTVDPLTFFAPSPPGTFSPEGQTFTILLHTAREDYVRGLHRK
ncbi:Six-hairpin glycosidase [Cristinia sonorae]|uniref:Six-hairpin glycosidase n=1 Tax=Cristinia sonorae TaxID=1940300 RepID=A0A8K0UXQ0_9AGAR|nr:Six-hairpin glycosidase [Cristinia sonorae]